MGAHIQEPNPTRPPVAVIVCTYNGAAHVEAQLESLLAQSWPVAIRVFDDVSADDTVQLVSSRLRPVRDELRIRAKNLGYVANFERAMIDVLDQGFEYLALCDQDDLWAPDRIALGMKVLLSSSDDADLDEEAAIPAGQKPRLVHSDLSMINAEGQLIHVSFLNYRGYATSSRRSLPIALGQNGVMGNTILMNVALARLALPFPKQLPVHDYWISLVAELFGHRQMLTEPTVQYRIHGSNVSNSSDSIRFGLSRWLGGFSWNRWMKRDFKLPFLEDARLNVVDSLLIESDARRRLSDNQRRQLGVFRAYLTQEPARLRLIVSMLRGGFIRTGLAHRCRFVLAQLLTRRYR